MRSSSSTKSLKFKPVLINDFIKGSTKNLVGLLKGGLFNGSAPKPLPTKGNMIIALKRRAVSDSIERKDMAKSTITINQTSNHHGNWPNNINNLDINQLCIDLKKQCSLLVDGAPKQPKVEQIIIRRQKIFIYFPFLTF